MQRKSEALPSDFIDMQIVYQIQLRVRTDHYPMRKADLPHAQPMGEESGVGANL